MRHDGCLLATTHEAHLGLLLLLWGADDGSAVGGARPGHLPLAEEPVALLPRLLRRPQVLVPKHWRGANAAEAAPEDKVQAGLVRPQAAEGGEQRGEVRQRLDALK